MTETETSAAQGGKTSLADAFRDAFAGDAPFVDKAKTIAKARPWASAALIGVAAIAVLNSIRGVHR